MKQRSKNRKRQPGGDYTIGFARPPKHTKFRPGNAAAKRRKGKKPETSLDIFKRVIREEITIRAGEESLRMTLGDAVLYANHQKALLGDARAQANMVKFDEVTRLMQNPSEDAPRAGILALPEPFDTDEEFIAWVRNKEEENRAKLRAEQKAKQADAKEKP